MIDVESGFQLAVIKGEDRGRNIPLQYREIHMGRKSSGPQQPHWIYFAEPTVSRHHATLVWDDVRRTFTIYHKSRTNPTLVNGKRVLHCALGHDDVVQIGLLVFRMEYVGDEADDVREAVYLNPPEEPRRQEFEDSDELTGGVQTGLRLLVVDGPDRGSVYPMTSTVLFIGRRDGLDDQRSANGILLNDDGLPKEQVLLAWNEREQTYGIFQVESSNLPTRIIRVEGGEQQAIPLGPSMQMLLQPDDVIRMGRTAIRLELDAVPVDEPSESSGSSMRDTLYMAGPPPRPRPSMSEDGVYDDDDEEPSGTALFGGRSGARAPLEPRRPEARKPSGWEPGPPDPSRRLTRRIEEGDSAASPGRRRREPLPDRTPAEEPEEAPTLPRPALFSTEPPEPRRPSSPSEAEPPAARGFPRSAPPPPPPEPDEPAGDEEEETRVVDEAPLMPSALEPIRFPSLDVNFVRNLPTRAAPPRPPEAAPPRAEAGRPATSRPPEAARPVAPRPSGPAPGARPSAPPPGTRPTAPPEAGRPAPPRPQQAPPPSPDAVRPAPPRPDAAPRQPEGGRPAPPRPQAPAPQAAPEAGRPGPRPAAPPTGRPAPPRPQPPAAAESAEPAPPRPGPSRPLRGTSDEAETVTRLSKWRPEAPAATDAMRRDVPDNLFESRSDDDDDVDSLDFKDSTFNWRYRADYVLGFLEGPNRGQKIELLTRQLEDGREITLGGRGERTNDIEIDDPAVINTQGTVTYDSGRFTLLNEAADGSIAINQVPMSHGDEMPLKTGDRISLGESVIIFLERAVVQVLSRFEVIVTSGIPEDKGRSFDLLREQVVVGRNKTCDIALADPEVSRKHLAVTLRNGRFYLQHMSTSNPTFINGVSLPRGRDRILNEGDKIQVSDHTTLLFRERPARR